MERFPRGTLPPSVEVAQTRRAPQSVPTQPTTIDQAGAAEPQAPRGTSDLASTCPTCNTLMQPEHAHYRCATCGYRDSCCF